MGVLSNGCSLYVQRFVDIKFDHQSNIPVSKGRGCMFFVQFFLLSWCNHILPNTRTITWFHILLSILSYNKCAIPSRIASVSSKQALPNSLRYADGI